MSNHASSLLWTGWLVDVKYLCHLGVSWRTARYFLVARVMKVLSSGTSNSLWICAFLNYQGAFTAILSTLF